MSRPDGFYAAQPKFAGNTVVEIAVPSGKLIAADDLRAVPHFRVEPPLSINYGVGLDAYARVLAEQANTAYAFVGNTCPVIARQADGSFEVIDPAWNEDTDGPELNSDERVVAEICTDLWATMLTDYQSWLDHGGPAIESSEGQMPDGKFTVFEVPAGRYRWTVYSHTDSFDTHAAGRLVFARLERIEAD
jgi:hypothetical protein